MGHIIYPFFLNTDGVKTSAILISVAFPTPR